VKEEGAGNHVDWQVAGGVFLVNFHLSYGTVFTDTLETYPAALLKVLRLYGIFKGDHLTRLYLPRSGMVEKASVGTCNAGFSKTFSLILNGSLKFFSNPYYINDYQASFALDAG
jgi:hypothetical protein